MYSLVLFVKHTGDHISDYQDGQSSTEELRVTCRFGFVILYSQLFLYLMILFYWHDEGRTYTKIP